ncbi:glycosyltransferase family 4 protein [Gammaproteobacteria bacterium]|nr:glycosyltransferase family 4 protein [Gammaproteobacteria bacterium]MDA9175381.1 glycosyltransferase family 4 protein [Gammaproteobacteria bacterium]MDA9834802.1 glycosyltransferase family 4 protein [Gammaproteobacteria bacterium]MDA9979315.1 glycosyltransferase family 4 protein [Gammaproteobacteria bacterium]MDC3372282.1 glycosyltransferase family 4 protein [Gammaproteobacteria bacterium]
MRILQLLPELKFGGVERGTVDLSEHLTKLGHHSAVVSAGGGLTEQLSNHGAKHFSLPIAKKNFLAIQQYKNLRDIYREFKPDIIHVRSRFPAWINLLALKGLPSSKPIVISTFHGLYSKPFYSKSMSYADDVIAISKTVQEYVFKNYDVDHSRVHLIYRGCDIDEFNTSAPLEAWSNAWYQEFPQTSNKILLTLPGRITGWKGIEAFLELLSQLDQAKYHGLIPGPVNENKKRYFQSLLALVKKYNLESAVTFCGARTDIANIYKVSDIVFNLSSKPEPFGRTIIEAAACGTHVMGWNRGGVMESIGMINPLGLIEFGDTDALATQIPYLLQCAPPSSIPSSFTKERLVEETIKVYESAIQREK